MIKIKEIDNFPIAFYIIEDETIVDCNVAAVNMFGANSKEDLIGCKPFDLSPEFQEDGQSSKIKGINYIKTTLIEKNVNFKWHHKKINGDIFLAYINLIKVNNSIFTLMTNIDEIKKLENTIKEKDSVYKLLFEDNKNVMLLIEPHTGNIIDANKAAVNYYGYKKITELNIRDIDNSDEEKIQTLLHNILFENSNFFMIKHKLANNEIRDVEVNSFPITLENKKYLFTIVYDVTEKVKQNLMFNNLFTNSPYAIAILDNNQNVLNINQKFTQLFQLEFEDVIGKNLNDLVTTIDFRAELDKNLDEVFKENVVKIVTIRKKKDNSLINVEILGFPIIFNNNIIGAYIHYIDITQKVINEQQLEVFKKVLENSNEGIIITDTNAYIQWVNNAFTRITGYSFKEIEGKNPRILQSNLQNKDFYKNMWNNLLIKNHWQGEIWNKNKNGDIYPEWLNIYAVKNNNITTHYVGMFRDLSEMKTIDQKMRILAQKDALTGLYNRLYFIEKLNYNIKTFNNDITAILFIDLDHFKEINDSLGHQAGDELLIELSTRLQSYLNGNNLIARYGGDEFVILLKGYKSKAQISQIARNIFNILNKPYIYQGNYLHVTGSIGISLYPNDGKTCEELIQNADIAMYIAKKSDDRQIVYYSNKMKKAIEERFKIANYLRKSIDNKDYKIIYEPTYDIYTNKIISSEAKLKWKSQQLTSISPNKYIEVASQTGQIGKIFECLLESTFIDLSKIKNQTVPISINLSIKQLEHSYFIPTVKEYLRKYNIKPKNIEFEFTDNNLKQNTLKVCKNISELIKMGINVAIDIVGEESFSIFQIKTCNINIIKIDKNIIKNLKDNFINYELIKTISSLSKQMDIKIIAKGISSKEQLEIARELKLDGAQGNYFTKPLNFTQLRKLIKTANKNLESNNK